MYHLNFIFPPRIAIIILQALTDYCGKFKYEKIFKIRTTCVYIKYINM